MEPNQLPKMNMNKSETDCCPKFDSTPWDEMEFELDNELFIKAKTRSFLHFPLNMGSTFTRVCKNIEDTKAEHKDYYLVMSYDPSPWRGEHYFAVKKDVPGEKMTKLSGKYMTKVFEGPYKNVKKWIEKMEKYVESKDKKVKKMYFFYTTCPKCAKHYGKNYVVAIAEI